MLAGRLAGYPAIPARLTAISAWLPGNLTGVGRRARAGREGMAYAHKRPLVDSDDTYERAFGKSEKAWLRPFGRGDLLPYWQAVNNPEIAHFTGHVPPLAFEELEAWYAQSVMGQEGSLDRYFSVCAPGSEVFVGCVWLWNSSPLDGHCELSVFISDKSLWGAGIGTEAVRLAVELAFDELGLEKVWLRVDAWNERAVKSYEKCGFETEGRLRRHRRTPEGWSDMLVMSVLRSA